MSDEKFTIQADVGRIGYLAAACPGCHRQRLELYADEGDERAVGVRCEKCGRTWYLDPAQADHSRERQPADPLRDGGEIH